MIRKVYREFLDVPKFLAFFVFFSKPEAGDCAVGFRRLASAQNLKHE